jgi:hypothetical protein
MNVATASRKRPLLALVPDHRRGFDSHHPLQSRTPGLQLAADGSLRIAIQSTEPKAPAL